MDNDILAIALMESLGVLSFLLAVMFLRQSREIGGKQEALKKATTTDDRGDGSCYSFKWVMTHIANPSRKLLNASPFLFVFISLIVGVWVYIIGPRVFSALVSLGYLSIVALIGIAILFKTDAFEAYSYGKAIHKIAVAQLNREDQSYLEIAKEALEKATARCVVIGIIFAVVGPLIPEIFNGVTYALLSYTSIVFQATEPSMKISQILTYAIAIILSGTLLFLPELLGRTVFRKVKLLIHKIWERQKNR